MAEAADLKSVQCGFESHLGHQERFTMVGFISTSFVEKKIQYAPKLHYGNTNIRAFIMGSPCLLSNVSDSIRNLPDDLIILDTGDMFIMDGDVVYFHPHNEQHNFQPGWV